MCQGKFGALGLSRRSSLMYKNLEFSSLHSLVEDYKHRDNVGSKTTKVEKGIVEKFYIEK